MEFLRFPELLRIGLGPISYFGVNFGLKALRAGNDLLLPRAEATKAFDSRGSIVFHKRLKLDPQNDLENARILAAQVTLSPPPSPTPKPEYRFSGQFGLNSRASSVLTRLMFESLSETESLLANEVFPMMRDGFQAHYVTGISGDFVRLQRLLSLPKFFLLFERFDGDVVRDLIANSGAFEGALPVAPDLLAYIEALTSFSPVSLTLPARHSNCAWHFQSRAMWIFDMAARVGAAEQFVIRPRSSYDSGSLFGMDALSGMNDERISQFLHLVAHCIDETFAYFANLNSFADTDGIVDFQKQIQTISSLHLLFGDLSAMSLSTASHSRLTFAMSILDKLANLRRGSDPGSSSEAAAFKMLCSIEQARLTSESIQRVCNALGYSDLGSSLATATNSSTLALQDEIRSQLPNASSTEDACLDRLRAQRNLRHGAFLLYDQFMKVFLESHGQAPKSLVSVSTLLVLGLICDPAKFLSDRPFVS